MRCSRSKPAIGTFRVPARDFGVTEPGLEDGDVDFEKLSTAQLQELVRRGRERRTNAEALALVEEAAASTPDAPAAEAV